MEGEVEVEVEVRLLVRSSPARTSRNRGERLVIASIFVCTVSAAVSRLGRG